MNVPIDETGRSPGDGAGSVIYEATYTDEHIVGLWQHLRRLKVRSRMFMRIFRIVAGLILVGLIVLVLKVGQRQQWPLAAALLGILAVLMFSERIDRWLLVRRWRKGHHRNRRARITFNSEGMSGQSDLGTVSNQWAAYTAAVRFTDGFLIFSGPYLPSWYRHADLVQGTPDDAATLFKANVPRYQET